MMENSSGTLQKLNSYKMKKALFTIMACSISLMAAAQFSDTTLTSLNWKFFDVGTKSARFTLPADTVDVADNDTVVFNFPVMLSTVFIARVTIQSDSLVDLLPEDPVDGNLLIESGPTSDGPWNVEKTIALDYSDTVIVDDFSVRDLYMRAKYIIIDGAGVVRTWITMKPSSISE